MLHRDTEFAEKLFFPHENFQGSGLILLGPTICPNLMEAKFTLFLLDPKIVLMRALNVQPIEVELENLKDFQKIHKIELITFRPAAIFAAN